MRRIFFILFLFLPLFPVLPLFSMENVGLDRNSFLYDAFYEAGQEVTPSQKIFFTPDLENKGHYFIHFLNSTSHKSYTFNEIQQKINDVKLKEVDKNLFHSYLYLMGAKNLNENLFAINHEDSEGERLYKLVHNNRFILIRAQRKKGMKNPIPIEILYPLQGFTQQEEMDCQLREYVLTNQAAERFISNISQKIRQGNNQQNLSIPNFKLIHFFIYFLLFAQFFIN